MKEIYVGKGVRVTESEDMGIFIHFESKSGNQTGRSLGNTRDTPGHLWATELLADTEHGTVSSIDEKGRETKTIVEAHLYRIIDDLTEALKFGLEIGDGCSRAYLGKFQNMANAALSKISD